MNTKSLETLHSFNQLISKILCNRLRTVVCVCFFAIVRFVWFFWRWSSIDMKMVSKKTKSDDWKTFDNFLFLFDSTTPRIPREKNMEEKVAHKFIYLNLFSVWKSGSDRFMCVFAKLWRTRVAKKKTYAVKKKWHRKSISSHFHSTDNSSMYFHA